MPGLTASEKAQVLRRVEGLIIKMSRRFKVGYLGDADDLYQEGVLKVLEVIKRYEMTKSFEEIVGLSIQSVTRKFYGFLRKWRPRKDIIEIDLTEEMVDSDILGLSSSHLELSLLYIMSLLDDEDADLIREYLWSDDCELDVVVDKVSPVLASLGVTKERLSFITGESFATERGVSPLFEGGVL